MSHESDVAAVLSHIDRHLPPLKGIYHAAMVLEDCLLVNLDRERMYRVMQPKISGAWNLHRLTLDRPLDQFVLFSTMSSVLGTAGQANYAAANAFLDSLAHYRRVLGLPALAVNWGYLGEVGYLARRKELGQRLTSQGVKSISRRQALISLERLLQGEAIQAGVTDIDWPRWRDSMAAGQVSPRFLHLCKGSGSSPNGLEGGSKSPREVVLALSPSQRRPWLENLLRDKVARVLGASPSRIDMETSLVRLGIDSLMAVDLRNWLEGDLHVSLPIVELMQGPSLARLVGVLLDQLSGGEAVPPAARPPDQPEDLLSHVAELSEQQVDELLTATLRSQRLDGTI